MSSSVIAVVVGHNGASFLPQTLAAIRAEAPETLICVDAGSTDGTFQLMSDAQPDRLVRATESVTFADAVQLALASLGRPVYRQEWVWLLHDDSAPQPGALAALRDAIERNPNASIVGPKVTEWDDPSTLVEFGLTMTRLGVSVNAAAGELDQAQFDTRTDVLAVGTAGCLVSAAAWERLGGLDPALAYSDDGLDLGVRAWLSGGRVVRAPAARVRHAQGQGREHRAQSDGSHYLAEWGRAYRHLVYARSGMLPLVWLALLPAAAVRSIWLLISKQPIRVPAALRAALAAMFSFRLVALARRRIRASRQAPWKALRPLRMRWRDYRRLMLGRREAVVIELVEDVDPLLKRVRFWNSPAPWLVGIAAALSALVWYRLLDASAAAGGGLSILPSSVKALWQAAVAEATSVQLGVLLPPDPANLVWALLGSATFWQTSWAFVVLWLVALPLAAAGGYLVARRLGACPAVQVVVGVAWAASPSFLASLWEGRVSSVLVHLVLPVATHLCLLSLSPALNRSQRITALSGAALLVAAVTVLSPVAGAVALVLLIAVGISRGRWSVLWAVLPSVALLAPTIVHAARTGQWWALLAETGLPQVWDPARRWWVALGVSHVDGVWSLVAAAPAVLLVLAALLGALGTTWRSFAGVLVFALGSVGAVLLAGLQVESVRGVPSAPWPGGLWSIAWLGLVAAAVPGLERLGGARRSVSGVLVALILTTAVPWGYGVLRGHADVQASNGEASPAIVLAEAATQPGVRVLDLTLREAEERSAAVVARLLPAEGELLTEQTIWETGQTALTRRQQAIAQLSANLLTNPDYDPSSIFAELGVQFVVLDGDDVTGVSEATTTMSANPALAVVGPSEYGELWRVNDVAEPIDERGGINVLWVIPLGFVLAVFALLAVPTSRFPTSFGEVEGALAQPIAGGDDDDEA